MENGPGLKILYMSYSMLVYQRVHVILLILSWELTYASPKACLKMILLLPMWDVFVPWRLYRPFWKRETTNISPNKHILKKCHPPSLGTVGFQKKFEIIGFFKLGSISPSRGEHKNLFETTTKFSSILHWFQLSEKKNKVQNMTTTWWFPGAQRTGNPQKWPSSF